MKLRSALIVSGITFFLTTLPQITYPSVVHLQGIALDSTVTFLKVIKPQQFWWNNNNEQPLVEIKRGSNSNTFDLSFQLDRPVQLWLISPEETWPIFCTPGDDISFVIKRNPYDKRHLIVKFDGPNSAQYNFVNELDDLGLRFSYPVFRGDPLDYRSSIEKWLGEREKLFETYRDRFQSNTAFVDYFNATIAYSRLNLLYIPLWNEKISFANLPAGYFDGTQGLSFTDEALLDNIEFSGAVVSKYICGYGSPLWDDFDGRYKMITSMKPGKIKEYLITFLIGLYAKYEAPQHERSLMKAFQEAANYVKNPAFRENINEIQKDYMKLNHVLPDSITDNTFLISLANNKKITLKEMLGSFKDQAVYIDFWAQWCVPCRENGKQSSEAKMFLKNEKIIYCYISIDKQSDLEKWQAAATTDGSTINQYLMVDGMNSALGKYLKLNYVPRYTLLDEAHLLKKSMAPRPHPNQLPYLTKIIKEMRTK